MFESDAYHSGLSKSSKAKRQAQFKKQADMDDDDPNAYKPAVGDKTAKTRKSTHTTKMQKMYPDVYEGKADKSLAKKAKASGMPLTQELRQLGIPVVTYTPSKGNDKHVRVNSVAPLFEAGQVWAPDERWAEEVIEECAAFPYGEHDDLVDSMTQALMRYRQGNFIALKDDYEDPIKPLYEQQPEYY